MILSLNGLLTLPVVAAVVIALLVSFLFSRRFARQPSRDRALAQAGPGCGASATTVCANSADRQVQSQPDSPNRLLRADPSVPAESEATETSPGQDPAGDDAWKFFEEGCIQYEMGRLDLAALAWRRVVELLPALSLPSGREHIMAELQEAACSMSRTETLADPRLPPRQTDSTAISDSEVRAVRGSGRGTSPIDSARYEKLLGGLASLRDPASGRIRRMSKMEVRSLRPNENEHVRNASAFVVQAPNSSTVKKHRPGTSPIVQQPAKTVTSNGCPAAAGTATPGRASRQSRARRSTSDSGPIADRLLAWERRRIERLAKRRETVHAGVNRATCSQDATHWKGRAAAQRRHAESMLEAEAKRLAALQIRREVVQQEQMREEQDSLLPVATAAAMVAPCRNDDPSDSPRVVAWTDCEVTQRLQDWKEHRDSLLESTREELEVESARRLKFTPRLPASTVRHATAARARQQQKTNGGSEMRGCKADK